MTLPFSIKLNFMSLIVDNQTKLNIEKYIKNRSELLI